MNMHINEVLSITPTMIRDKTLCRVLYQFGEPIEVAGAEQATLVVLLNLTCKRSDTKDLCDEEQARALLRDEIHLRRCLHTLGWLHTHNLKYPDARVSGQRLLVAPPELRQGVITSAGLPRTYGWANNSADINFARLFCSRFLYQGQLCSLALQMQTNPTCWLQAFGVLGLKQQQLVDLQQAVMTGIPAYDIPDAISQYSKQVRFPVGDDYLAITPVVSDALMSQVQTECQGGRLRHTLIRHPHSAAVGSLAAASGGYVQVMNYPPPIRNRSSMSFVQSRAYRMAEGGSLFDHGIVKDPLFVQTLQNLIEMPGMTNKAKAQLRRSALKALRKGLGRWLGPVIELRDAMSEMPGLNEEVATNTSLERRLAEWPQDELVQLSGELSKGFHLALQSHAQSRRFAYHPDLIEPIHHQMTWLLKQLAGTEPDSITETTECFLHLSGLRVYDASSLANPYLCGIPSLSALVMTMSAG